MTSATIPTSSHDLFVRQRADDLFRENQSHIFRRTDRLFACLMVLQWVGGVAAAAWISPRTWAGAYSETHIHVWAAILLGGLITLFPVYLAMSRPGSALTRQVIAISQMLTSALLIHLSGGRIETHFHVFGSLAFLACYRDWRVIASATIVVLADHFIRGIYYPQSVFGVLTANPWRVTEHAAWVVFENTFLVIAIRQSVGEMKAMARQRAELEASNERFLETQVRYRSILENVVDSVITIGETGTIEEFNSAAEKMFGFTADEVLGESIERLMPSPYREQYRGYLSRYIATGKKSIIGARREVIGKRKDGTTFPIELAVSEVFLQTSDTNKQLLRLFTGVVRDLTGVKENVELKRAKAELVFSKEAAESANQTKSEFLANMSHEIRTPMTAILGYAEIVLANVRDPENVEGLETIKRNGQHLLEIINDILDLSKIESGKLEVEQVECSPCQLLTDVASLMRVRASGKGLSLEVAYEGAIPQHIQTDPTRLRQILINLIGNAIKFTEVGSVRIVARLLDSASPEPVMQFDIVDTGIGMTDEQIGKLFQPFVQADTSTTRKFGGTGLGLTISKRLAEMLEGGIHVQSAEGHGSTFSVTVSTGPLEGVDMVASPTEAEACSRRVARTAAADVRLDCRILLAEDGPDNQRLISYLLTRAGADVTVAENGQIAHDLTLAARDAGTPFDVILMDMQMPVLDGYGATGKLREAGYSGPIIALTAHAMASDRAKCLDAGCDDYTTKPIDRVQLISLIARYASEQTPTEIVEVPT